MIHTSVLILTQEFFHKKIISILRKTLLKNFVIDLEDLYFTVLIKKQG